MPVIWGQVESVVTRRNVPPSVVVTAGAYRTECVVGARTRMARGFEPLRLEAIRPGEFVVAAVTEHAGWLEAERIDVIIFQENVSGVKKEEEPIIRQVSLRPCQNMPT